MFPSKVSPVEVKAVLYGRFASSEVTEMFPRIADLHCFLCNYLGDKEKVSISK
jgi:hypothetical protein